MQLSLIPIGENAPPKGTSSVTQFFNNIEALAEKDKLQAAILFAMLFTFVIWVFEMLSLALSLILYLLFLWHHIPAEDGSLRAYCRRKIDSRLERIVKKKVNKALAKGLALQDRKRADLEAGLSNGTRQPTLPTFGYASSTSGSEMPSIPGLSRQTTTTTLPPYSSVPPSIVNGQTGMNREPTLPGMTWETNGFPMGNKGPGVRSSDDTASLVDNASSFAYNAPGPVQVAPSLPPIERYGTPLSAMSDFRPPTGQARRTPAPSTVGSVGRQTPRMQTPASAESYSYGRPPLPNSVMPDRTMTAPLPSATPAPNGQRNFARPWPAPRPAQGPRQGSAPQSFDSLPSPRRAGTAPPFQDSQYNGNPRY